ncbi:hypothetical protein CN177_34190 [Sinorhizobium meliloti]|nr:hypothetical protein CN219_16925 [Sinorhizobium meliloti]RVI37160.1 hypothetical protein CN197_09565 [Sinorhizobium meliloti]RVI42048.1 hypothetical protein CN196_23355 [Sinorhizobium meliloti]RVJ15119.1 hypothetical protein CN177_34190 [Sinorhizobium meliloti]RVJ88003.1 hypothetical protein CN170_32175 [Sinorhizobium meliloti]
MRRTKSEMHGFHVHNPCSMFRFVLIPDAHTRAGMGTTQDGWALVFNSPFEAEWRARRYAMRGTHRFRTDEKGWAKQRKLSRNLSAQEHYPSRH